MVERVVSSMVDIGSFEEATLALGCSVAVAADTVLGYSNSISP